MKITPQLLGAVLRAALHEYPREAVGVLVGRGPEPLTSIGLTNGSDRPETTFHVPDDEVLRLHRALHDTGRRLVAVWHSHTRGDDQPSDEDIDQHDPAHLMVIVDLTSLPAVAVRAFAVDDIGPGARTATEVPVVVTREG